MKKLIPLVFLALIAWSAPRVFGKGSDQDVIVGEGSLQITLHTTGGGGELTAITLGTTPALDAPSPLFTLYLSETSGGAAESIASTGGWGDVRVTNDGTHCRLVFSSPVSGSLPPGLTASIGITVTGTRSQWDLSVTGLGSQHTLTDADFPEFNLKAPGGDQFLIPKYSGVLVPDPVAAGMDYDMFYPRGWSATMPFLAYYNADYGLYLGFHDPQAALKHFRTRAASGHLHFQGNAVVADKTVPGNDWDFPGHFELDAFAGDWYDAALIYKAWAADEAEYWPQETPARAARQAQLGNVGVWGYYSADVTYPMTGTNSIESDMQAFIDYFPGVPVGIHWYKWNLLDFDDDYPNYFPERAGMADLVGDLQQSGRAYIMPYINGRLYDTDLTGEWDYATRGFPHATKRSDGTAYTQTFNGNTFAVMCPTRPAWQNIIADAAQQLTERIGSKGVYIDQVAAAGPTECMDATHNHPLGGGHWWRDGYAAMFAEVHAALPEGRFVVVEGGADYLADQVDGFLTDGWLTNNLVPAFQAVYGGRVQLIGKRTGTSRYHNQSFYCKLSQALVQGVQPGRNSLWIVHDSNADLAAPFLKRMATMRFKLRDYLAFGEMLRPLSLTGSIPDITSSWTDYGTPVDVTISAIQSGVYRHREDGSLALIFVNASMSETIDFAFDFEGSRYGFAGQVYVQRITESGEETPQLQENAFTQTVSLAPLDAAAYLIVPRSFDTFLPLISTR